MTHFDFKYFSMPKKSNYRPPSFQSKSGPNWLIWLKTAPQNVLFLSRIFFTDPLILISDLLTTFMIT